MVSHDLHVVMAASDRVICLNGHVCCEGTPTVVSAAPEYRALFGFGTQGALALYRHDHDHGHAATGTRTGTHGHAHGHARRRVSLLDDFLVRAVLAGVGVALAAGPLGCFVVWRRMAYFGDATAHAALLGVTLALATDAAGGGRGGGGGAGDGARRSSLAAGRSYAADTLLGVASHGGAGGRAGGAELPAGVRVDLMGYLFGDILAVTRGDLAVIWGGAALVVALLAWRWRQPAARDAERGPRRRRPGSIPAASG